MGACPGEVSARIYEYPNQALERPIFIRTLFGSESSAD